MIDAMKRMMLACMLAAALAAASSGCRGDSTPARFVYTPVPYTVVRPLPVNGTPQPTMVVSIGESGQEYSADLILADVDKSAKARFERWADSLGFTVTSSSVTDNSSLFDYTSVLVKVPPGSAPAALELIRKQPGVRTAGLSYFYRTLD